jgi:hypothetical protein
LLKALVTAPRKLSKARPASALVKPDESAIASISSDLFIIPPKEVNFLKL